MKAGSSKVIFMILVAAVVAGCSGQDDEDMVVEAFERFQTGLKGGDGAALWGVADDATRAYFDEFAASIRGTCRLVRDNYPQDDRAATMRAVGGDLEASARDGRSLFMYMLDIRKLAPPENRDSTIVRDIKFDGAVATVVTKSGETILFTKNTDGSWGTRMFLAAFTELPAIVTLKDNIRVAQENCRMLGIDVDAVLSAK